jgi:hypothetical protein
MKANYETLDEYLDDLDTIKARVARETEGMTAKQVKAYFARAARQLLPSPEQRQPSRRRRKLATAKR